MTQENKDLLFQDINGRLTYGVKAYIKNWSKLDRKYYEGVYTIESTHPSLNIIFATTDRGSVEVILGYDDYVFKPYLFPLSSMTEEQEEEYNTMYEENRYSWKENIIDWFHKNHLDYRGLIPKGLAIDATGLNIY